MPTAAFVLNAGVYDRAQASQARVLLDRTYSLEGVEPRISVVIGTERMLKALTVYLMDDGFDLAGSPVRTIALFGGHVTPNRKRLLSRLWQARVQDNYSLTEVFGGATEANRRPLRSRSPCCRGGRASPNLRAGHERRRRALAHDAVPVRTTDAARPLLHE